MGLSAIRGHRGRSGAAAAELVLILPILIALVLGISSIGLGHYRKLTLSQAAREAARYGATLPAGSSGVDSAWLDDVADRARYSAFGQLADTVEGQYLCVAYVGVEPVLGSTTTATTKREESGGAATYSAGWCYDDGRAADERRVQVVLQRISDFDAFWFREAMTLEGRAVAAFEAVRLP